MDDLVKRKYFELQSWTRDCRQINEIILRWEIFARIYFCRFNFANWIPADFSWGLNFCQIRKNGQNLSRKQSFLLKESKICFLWNESAKWRACELAWFTCLVCSHTWRIRVVCMLDLLYVLAYSMNLAWLRVLRAWKYGVLGVLQKMACFKNWLV